MNCDVMFFKTAIGLRFGVRLHGRFAIAIRKSCVRIAPLVQPEAVRELKIVQSCLLDRAYRFMTYILYTEVHDMPAIFMLCMCIYVYMCVCM